MPPKRESITKEKVTPVNVPDSFSEKRTDISQNPFGSPSAYHPVDSKCRKWKSSLSDDIHPIHRTFLSGIKIKEKLTSSMSSSQRDSIRMESDSQTALSYYTSAATA